MDPRNHVLDRRYRPRGVTRRGDAAFCLITLETLLFRARISTRVSAAV